VVADVVDNDYGGQTQPIIAGAVSGDDEHRIVPLPNTAAGRAALIAPPQPVAKKPVPEPEPEPPRKSRRRGLLAAAAVLLLALAGIGLGYNIIRGNYYVGAHDDQVSIMRGIQGSFLGVPLQQPYQLGCINDRGELSQISYGQADTALDCDLMRLVDLRPAERAQVTAGLPAGSLDQAIDQLRELANSSLLPPCTQTTPAVPSPAPRSGSGAPAAPTTGSAPSSALPAPSLKPGTDCRATA
jgi:protein phosphatase